MTKRMRSVWISQNLTTLFGINLCGFESNREGVLAELEAVEAALKEQLPNSLLVVLDIAQTDMMPELAVFIKTHPCQGDDPIRKMAIVGISDVQKTWYQLTRKVTWPKNAQFFDEHEKAKAWLLVESY